MKINSGYFIEGNKVKIIQYGNIKEGRIEYYRDYQDNIKEILKIQNILETLKEYKRLLTNEPNKITLSNNIVRLNYDHQEPSITLRYIEEELTKYQELLDTLEANKTNTLELNNITNPVYIRIDHIDNIEHSKHLRILLKACYIIDEYPSFWRACYQKGTLIKETKKRRYTQELINMMLIVLETEIKREEEEKHNRKNNGILRKIKTPHHRKS